MSIDIVAATPELQSPALPPGGRATCERSAGCALSLGGRRSDIRRKHDVVQLRRLDNGLGYYRFAYNGSEKAYVGVIAQQVRSIRPDAAFCRSRRLFRVSHERLGQPFRSMTIGLHPAAGCRSLRTTENLAALLCHRSPEARARRLCAGPVSDVGRCIGLRVNARIAN
jgi:hypothetical protein